MKRCLNCQHVFEGAQWSCALCGWKPQRVGPFVVFAPEVTASSPGYKPEHFAVIAQLEADNFWFRSRNRLLKWALTRYFGGAQSFMEIGCGTGYVLQGIHQAYPHLQVAGSEIFTEGLDFAAQRLQGIDLFQMDACQIPYNDEFDVVGAFDVLEHIGQDEQAISQMYQAVRIQVVAYW